MQINDRKPRFAGLAAALVSATLLAASVSVNAAIDLYWKFVPATTAWVNPYQECWQGIGGHELPPCNQPVAEIPRSPLVLNLQFGLNKYQLQDIENPQELRKLDDLIKGYLASPREEVVTIVGHTDQLGSLKHNLALSERRAQTIKQYMIDHGFPARDIQSVQGVAWEGSDESDLGPLANNPLRRRVVVREVNP